MQKRWAIVEPSELGKNIYRLLLSDQKVFSLTFYSSLAGLKELLARSVALDGLVIDASAFGDRFDQHLEWLRRTTALHQISKIILCAEGEKSRKLKLHAIPRTQILSKPFHPDDFYSLLDDKGGGV